MDPNGLIKLPPGFAKRFPKSARLIQTMGRRITRKKLLAWMRWGDMPAKFINGALSPGRGPEIFVDSALPCDEGYYMYRNSWGQRSTQIHISEWNFRNYEKAKSGSASEGYHRRALLRVIEHEFTHWLDWQDNSNKEPTIEEGWAYEKQAYGWIPAGGQAQLHNP